MGSTVEFPRETLRRLGGAYFNHWDTRATHFFSNMLVTWRSENKWEKKKIGPNKLAEVLYDDNTGLFGDMNFLSPDFAFDWWAAILQKRN